MSETVFLELFSLSSCLPGPTSTQVSFALGAVKRGIPGGLLGGALFQYPGLFMMAAIGVGAANFLQDGHWWTRAAVDGAVPRDLPPFLQLSSVGFQLCPDMRCQTLGTALEKRSRQLCACRSTGANSASTFTNLCPRMQVLQLWQLHSWRWQQRV